MIFVPLPFVVALLLLILLGALLRNSDLQKENRPFLALIGLTVLQSVAVGLRWGYGFVELHYVLPVLAACLPPLVLASFRKLINQGESDRQVAIWVHALPPFIIIALLVVMPQFIDVTLMAVFIGYAIALLRLGRWGPDGLDEARFESAIAAHRALVIAAASLCLSASFDLAVYLDFAWSRGHNAILIVSNANLLGLLLLGLTAIVAAQAKALPEPATQGDLSLSETGRDRGVLDSLDLLLNEQKLFLDDNLTLARLARRSGIPARQISGAVNRLAGKNVSQYINDFRIAEACRLLQTSSSVTAAMFESGFQTKSNFNREFRRVTSLSPTEWLEKNRMT